MFQLIVLLKPDFNCCICFALSWVDKVATGTQSFVSVILNLVAPVESNALSDQFKMRLISQLINGISRVLRKLLKYFYGTAISTSFV